METKRYEFVLEAEQPVAHHAESFGNHAVCMRRKIRQSSGAFADVPVITGDTMRHGMREASAYALLDAAGLLSPSDGSPAGLSESALRLLFAGGMVTGRGDGGTISLDEYREMAELIPSLALFGGCASNRVIPGRLMVDDAVLVCAESARFLPAWVAGLLAGQEIGPARSHVEETQRVRMDPTLDPGKRKLLSTGAQVSATNRLAASERAHDADDATERAESKSSMLPRTFERVAQGSLFSWSVTAHTYSDLDTDTLLTTLGVFCARPMAGGKRGTGHGRLRVLAARDITLQRPSETENVVDVTALGGRVGSLFRAHVAERKDRIRSFLEKVDA